METLLSGPGLAREHALRHGGTLDAAAIAQRAAAGDAACAATLARHAQRLARALAAVINLLDPDVIVLGGGLSLMPHLYADVPRLWSLVLGVLGRRRRAGAHAAAAGGGTATPRACAVRPGSDVV